MIDLADGIRSMRNDDLISQTGAKSVLEPQASNVPPAVEDVAARQQSLTEQVQANETLLRRQVRWAWLALGKACLVAVVILLLAIWGATRLTARAANEADMIRAANAAELTEAHETGQRAIVELHEELSVQRYAAEQQIDEAFPTCASHRVAQHVFKRGQPQQGMQDAGIAHIDAWGFYKALADIGVPWLQPAHQHQINQQVEIGGDGFAIDPERAAQLGPV